MDIYISSKKKTHGNEKQFKHNTIVLSELMEADDHLPIEMGKLSGQNVLYCREALSQGKIDKISQVIGSWLACSTRVRVESLGR